MGSQNTTEEDEVFFAMMVAVTGEGGFHGTKRSTHHRPSQVGGNHGQMARIDETGSEVYLGLTSCNI